MSAETIRHQARAVQVGDGWHASDAQCGYFSRRPSTDETAAARLAERHNRTATAADQRVWQTLYGPRPKR